MQRQQAPFRADIVGSFLRPDSIKQARQQLAEGIIDAAQLREIENNAIRHLVQQQCDCGLHVVTDGEFRRAWWHFDFFDGLQGVERYDAEQGIQFNGVQTKAHGVRVTGKLAFGDHPMLEDFRYLKSISGDAQPKMTIPSPSVLHFRGGRKDIDATVYPDLSDYFDDLATTCLEALRRPQPRLALGRSLRRVASAAIDVYTFDSDARSSEPGSSRRSRHCVALPRNWSFSSFASLSTRTDCALLISLRLPTTWNTAARTLFRRRRRTSSTIVSPVSIAVPETFPPVFERGSIMPNSGVAVSLLKLSTQLAWSATNLSGGLPIWHATSASRTVSLRERSSGRTDTACCRTGFRSMESQTPPGTTIFQTSNTAGCVTSTISTSTG